MMSGERKAVSPIPEEYTEIAEERHELPAKRHSRGRIHESDRPPQKRKRSCPDYFGVKSYLHNFYDASAVYKDPIIYEDDDDLRYLLAPYPRRRRCPPIWWKIFMWVGVNLLLFGVIGILVGYLVPPKHPLERVDEIHDIAFVDRSAEAYNTTLDMCKLIGLILFCVGGITLAMSLLFPSFLSHYCDDDGRDEAIKVPLRDGEKTPLSPIEMTIPSSSKVRSVQPARRSPESVMTQGGTKSVKD
ncbi:neurensin-1-like [Haliotis rufescens]|uniref:neurensin-1-like n=1 Tax=Haliotis rufescens TaxID=6454 RepID=UPI001EB08CBE|nr:neurensin-1-like [Haliotis rufescens]XP_048255489.1 neurensin-1-like [Haliotis rufescens]